MESPFTGDMASRLLETEKEVAQLRASRRELRRQLQDAVLVGETLQHEYLELRAKNRRQEEEFQNERLELMESLDAMKRSVDKEREMRMQAETKEESLQSALNQAISTAHVQQCVQRELEMQVRSLREDLLNVKPPTVELEQDRYTLAEMEEMVQLLKARNVSLEEQLHASNDKSVKFDDFETIVVALRQTVRELQHQLSAEQSVRQSADRGVEKLTDRYAALERNSVHAISLLQLSSEETRSSLECDVENVTASWKGSQEIVATYREAMDRIHEAVDNPNLRPIDKLSVIAMPRSRCVA